MGWARMRNARIKDITATCLLTDAYLLLQEIRGQKRQWTLEMDYQLEHAKAERAELKFLIEELRTEINRLRADSLQNRRILALFIDSNGIKRNAGDLETTEEDADTDRDSPESSIVSGFLSHKRRRRVRQNSHG